jgi:hypothetical protein
METLSKIHPTRWVVGFIVLVGVIVLAGSSFVIIEADYPTSWMYFGKSFHIDK